MKKVLAMVLALALVFSLTGCFGSKLEEGQSRVVLNKDGELTIEMMVEDKDAEDMWDIDFDDKVGEIEEDIIDEWEDTVNEDNEIQDIKKKGDYLYIKFFVEDMEDVFGYEADMTLEDYLDEWSWYEDFEEMQEEMEFVDYKSEDEIDEDELEDFEDYLVLRVYGDEEGSYWEVPGKIVLVSGDCDYQREGNNVIFIEEDEGGVIVYED